MKGLADFMLDHEGGQLWVAEINGKAAGSIAITKTNESVAQLRWFVLDEAYHGLGVGNQLMETALDFCRQQGYQQVYLWTVSVLEAARHLYGKYGFSLTEEKPNVEWTESTLIEERWDLNLQKSNS